MPRLLVLSAALLFSTGGAAIKATSLTGWQVACFRSGVAAAVLLLCMPAWRRAWSLRTLAVGVAYATTMVLFVLANKLTTAANTIFLQYTAPIYLLLLAPWLLRESVRRADLLLVGALGVGMALFFVGTDPPHLTAPDPVRGNWLAALTGLSWALTLLGLRWLGRAETAADPHAAGVSVIVGNLLACAVCLPLALPVLGRGVGRMRALEVSLLLLLEPVLNAVWAWLLHGEAPGAESLAGCGVILLATLALTLRGRD
jgi:drug/metabolite transporter (DMT)-like permease